MSKDAVFVERGIVSALVFFSFLGSATVATPLRARQSKSILLAISIAAFLLGWRRSAPSSYWHERGLAERSGDDIRYRRNLLRHLRQRELSDVGEQLAKETGLDFFRPPENARIEGVYRRAVTLASGKFAVLEKSKEFTLVPWRAALERHRGKLISGEMRGTTLSFEVSKNRGGGVG